MISLVRGDTKRFKFHRWYCNDEIIEEIADEVVFSLRTKPNVTTTPTFQKKLSTGTITYDTTDFYYRLTLDHDDTKDLNYGTYYIDIKVINGGDDYKTIFEDTLKLTEV